MKAAAGRVKIALPPGTSKERDAGLKDMPCEVHDDLFCNVLLLDDGDKRICLLSMEPYGLDYSACDRIKNGIEKNTGIFSSDTVIWGAYTHFLQNVGKTEGPSCQPGEYTDEVVNKIVDGVAGINKNYQEVKLKAGKAGIPDSYFNGRLVGEKRPMSINSLESGISDITGGAGHDLISLTVWDRSGNLFAVLINFIFCPSEFAGYVCKNPVDFISCFDEHLLNSFGERTVILSAVCTEGNPDSPGNHAPDQLPHFDEMKKAVAGMGRFVSESMKNSSVLNGKIHFVSEEITTPFSEMAEQLQGLAIGSYAFVTIPAETCAGFGRRIIMRSPYKNTMVIGLPNSFPDYPPARVPYLQKGSGALTAGFDRLADKNGNVLEDLVSKKILNPLLMQSRRIMDRKASDNKYMHKDFHISLNLLMEYIYGNFGESALIAYLEQFAVAYFKPLKQKLESGDLAALRNYFTDIYNKEEWPVRIFFSTNVLEIEQEACPAISHIRAAGGKPCPCYRETYSTIYKTLCMNTSFKYTLEYFDEETGACKQIFTGKEEKR